MLLTFDELANILKADAPTVLRFLKAGDIPAPVFLGDQIVRWPSAVIKNWAAVGCPLCAPLSPDAFARLRKLRLIEWANTPEGLAATAAKDNRDRQQRRRTNRKPISAAGNVADGNRPGQ
jgi:predicted DNA-binding transcriptional regulator AlpA